MKNYLFKIRHIIPAGLAVILGWAAAYILLVWLLVFGLQIAPVKKEILQQYLPFILSAVVFWVTLRNRFGIIRDNDSSRMDWQTFLRLLTWGAMVVSTILSYGFVIHRFSSLQEVENVEQIDRRSADLFYRIDDVSTQQVHAGVYTDVRTIPRRYRSDMQFSAYIVFPFAGSENVWYAINYSKKVEYSTDESVENGYKVFLSGCDNRISAHDFGKYHLFERITASEDRDGFLRAVADSDPSLSADEAVLLRPLTKGYTDISGENLRWMLYTVGIWLAAMLILLIFAPLNYKLLTKKLTLSETSRKTNDGFPDLFRLILIPNRHNWPLSLIVDAILGYFILMTACGVSPLSPSSQELYEWGALRSSSLYEGAWWRVITSMFMHGNIMHLLCNLVTLGAGLFFGARLFGIYKTALLFLVSGICADTIAALLFNGTYVGASGAIMGIMGAVLAVYARYPGRVVARLGLWWIVITTALTLVIGIRSGISNTAHITGLIAGALLGLLLFSPQNLKKYHSAAIDEFTDTEEEEITDTIPASRSKR